MLQLGSHITSYTSAPEEWSHWALFKAEEMVMRG